MPDPEIKLAAPTGVWRPVYVHRTALHATADTLVLAAWQADLAKVSLAATIRDWQTHTSPTQSPAERLQAATAAILAFLSTLPWARTLAALALNARRAHRTGWAAGQQIASRHPGDDTAYSDDGSSGSPLAPADLSDRMAAHTAASTLAAALGAAARRLARLLVAGTTAAGALKDALTAGFDILVATDVAVSAAYGAGLRAAYMGLGVQSLTWVTAGDDDVCERCDLTAANSPYSPFGVPAMPMHPNCRCILRPS